MLDRINDAQVFGCVVQLKRHISGIGKNVLRKPAAAVLPTTTAGLRGHISRAN